MDSRGASEETKGKTKARATAKTGRTYRTRENSRKATQARGGHDQQLEKDRNHHKQTRLGTAQGNGRSQKEKRPPKQERERNKEANAVANPGNKNRTTRGNERSAGTNARRQGGRITDHFRRSGNAGEPRNAQQHRAQPQARQQRPFDHPIGLPAAGNHPRAHATDSQARRAGLLAGRRFRIPNRRPIGA